jgi:uncharacterized membrane protein SpoIIM required for sporulation
VARVGKMSFLVITIIFVVIVAAFTGLLGIIYNKRIAKELYDFLTKKKIKDNSLKSCRFWLYLLSFGFVIFSIWSAFLLLNKLI